VNRDLVFVVLTILCLAPAHAQIQQPQSIDSEATHQQVATIQLQESDPSMRINAFCLNQQGQIVAACGAGPGQIRIANDEGRVEVSWNVAVKPEAVNVAPDGSVLVGGEGKLFRFDSKGNLLLQADSPHATALRNDKARLRSEAVAYLNRATNSLQARIESYERVIAELEEKATKTELNAQEQRMLELLPQTLATYQKQAEQQALANKGADAQDSGVSEKAIEDRVENMIRSKMKVSSISADQDHVFVATQDITGYGYVVWKMGKDFSGGEVIVSGLRGCCGQMDVQCCRDGLFVAENSRHRVVRFDVSGEQTTTWGKQDRTGVDGFSSCCNPMNVCFNQANEVYTAESSTGRIKRFTADGTFLSYVGDVDLVPGCKNVSIAASPEGDKIYMLDLTRNHIVLMKLKSAATNDDVAAAEK
jgi:hypothetical protein